MEFNSGQRMSINRCEPEALAETPPVKIRYFLPYGFRVRLSDES
jgi:hypothetical protein